MRSDDEWMRLALGEARKGVGQTSPNPAVGAVIVRDGVLVGKGWHRGAGRPHAEVTAIRSLKPTHLSRGATIYVTLEPCSTHGRTPPCVDAILEHGFSRVVVGATDPNPLHAGRGLDLLKNAGIEVVYGVLEKECRSLNEAFNKWIVTGQPLVIAKCAMSLDGRITRPPGEDSWLTSAKARHHAHQLRSQVDAILVGGETVRRDNPHLTVRGVKSRRQPWRVVLSRSGNLPESSRIFTDTWKDRTLVFSDLTEALTELGKRQATSVLIEGGGKVLGDAFDKKLVDRIAFHYAPMIVGGDVPAVGGQGVGDPASAIELEEIVYEKLGVDLLALARIKK